MQNTGILSICLSMLQIVYISSERILGQERTDDFDFDGIPGANHEFKIEVAAGSEECFYQKVPKGGNIHINYEVLKGGDRLLDVYVKDPDFQIIDSHISKSDGTIEKPVEREGIYTLCLDNTYSRYMSRLVYVYLVTFVVEEWTNYVKEIQGLSGTVNNFTQSITDVQTAINDVKTHQAHSRMNVIKDWYLITGNNSYVMKWSILQCVVIFFTYGMTTYFVRRLFRTPVVTPTAKPRA